MLVQVLPLPVVVVLVVQAGVPRARRPRQVLQRELGEAGRVGLVGLVGSRAWQGCGGTATGMTTPRPLQALWTRWSWCLMERSSRCVPVGGGWVVWGSISCCVTS